jgi:hypothetical protein
MDARLTEKSAITLNVVAEFVFARSSRPHGSSRGD